MGKDARLSAEVRLYHDIGLYELFNHHTRQVDYSRPINFIYRGAACIQNFSSVLILNTLQQD